MTLAPQHGFHPSWETRTREPLSRSLWANVSGNQSSALFTVQAYLHLVVPADSCKIAAQPIIASIHVELEIIQISGSNLLIEQPFHRVLGRFTNTQGRDPYHQSQQRECCGIQNMAISIVSNVFD